MERLVHEETFTSRVHATAQSLFAFAQAQFPSSRYQVTLVALPTYHAIHVYRRVRGPEVVR